MLFAFFLLLGIALKGTEAFVPYDELFLFKRADSQGPNSLAKQHGKWFGSAFTNGLTSDSSVMKYYNDSSQIGQITPENEMKPQSIDKGGGTYDYSAGDSVAAQAAKTGAKLRCHFLLGPNQNGAGLASASGREQALSYLEKYIKSTVEHYGTKCYSWDVVNEALTEQGSLRSDVPGTSKIGQDFVEKTFEIASKYAPSGVKLCYNDYNLESSSAKLDGAIALAKKIKAAGARIDCIGFESHLSSASSPSLQSYKSSLNKAASVVAETPITELDVASSGNEQQQATAYNVATKTCVEVKSCPGVTVWGLSDKHGWLQGKNADILDSNGREKPAVAGITSALGSSTASSFTPENPANTSTNTTHSTAPGGGQNTTTPSTNTTTPVGGGNTPPVPGGSNPTVPGGNGPTVPGGNNPLPIPGGNNPSVPGGNNPPGTLPATCNSSVSTGANNYTMHATQNCTVPTSPNTTPPGGGSPPMPGGFNNSSPGTFNFSQPGSNNYSSTANYTWSNSGTPLSNISTSNTTAKTWNSYNNGYANNGVPSPWTNVPKNGNGFTVQGSPTGQGKGHNGKGGHGGRPGKRCRPDRGAGSPPST